tara:strand:- start:58 stop:159 length:102 start_codon:yes stop_codon:yes gene_type:complete
MYAPIGKYMLSQNKTVRELSDRIKEKKITRRNK